MLEAPHFSANGARLETAVALPDDYFDGTVNQPVLHQAVTVFLANQRQGTHQTKTRRYVAGGNQKPWRQKGTGRARQGTIRAPHWRGGGIVFGPHPRDYRQDVPRKVRQLARRSALNARAQEGNLWVIDSLSFERPKTARFAELLEQMGLADKKVLALTQGVKPNVYLSGRNIPGLHVMPYSEASAYDVLWADAVVVEHSALTGEAAPEEPVAAAARAAPARKPAKTRVPAKPKAKSRTAAKASPKAKPVSAKGRAPKAPRAKKAADQKPGAKKRPPKE